MLDRRIEEFLEKLERQWSELHKKLSKTGKWEEFLQDVRNLIRKIKDPGSTYVEITIEFEKLFDTWGIEYNKVYRAPVPSSKLPDKETKRLIANRINRLIKNKGRRK